MNLHRSVSSFRLILRVSALRCRFSSVVTSANSRCQDLSSFASYLMQNFGLNRTSATRTASKWRFKSMENPNAVVALFKEHGFSHNQLSKIIRYCPQILNINPATTKPKIDFLYSKLEDSSEVVRVLSSYPLLLASSLENTLIPSFNFLTTIFSSERDAASVVRCRAGILMIKPNSSAAKNLEIMIARGVPKCNLVVLFKCRGQALHQCSALFEEALEKVERMGFDPNTSRFLIALGVLGNVGKQGWEKKVKLYMKFGWSEEELSSAFRKHPRIGFYSEQKVESVLKFLREEMGIEASEVAKYPNVIGQSMEKRIIPRAYIFKVLLSKGLRKKMICLQVLFCLPDSKFIERVILRHKEGHSLAKLYKEKMAFVSNCKS